MSARLLLLLHLVGFYITLPTLKKHGQTQFKFTNSVSCAWRFLIFWINIASSYTWFLILFMWIEFLQVAVGKLIHIDLDMSTGTITLRHFSWEIRRYNKRNWKCTETISCRTLLGDNQGRFCVHAAIVRNNIATIRMTETALKQFYPVCRTIFLLLERRPLIAQIILNLLLGI